MKKLVMYTMPVLLLTLLVIALSLVIFRQEQQLRGLEGLERLQRIQRQELIQLQDRLKTEGDQTQALLD